MAVPSPPKRRSTSPPPSAWCHASPWCTARSQTASLKPSSKHSSATTLAYIHCRMLLRCSGRSPGVQRQPPSLWARNDLPQGVHSGSGHLAGCPVKRGQHHLLYRLYQPKPEVLALSCNGTMNTEEMQHPISKMGLVVNF